MARTGGAGDTSTALSLTDGRAALRGEKEVEMRTDAARLTAQRRRTGPLVAILLAAAFALMGFIEPALGRTSDATADIAFINGMPDAPAIDIYVDGMLTTQNLLYGRATEFLPIPAGKRAIAVTATGDVPDAVITSRNVQLLAGATYAIGSVGPQADAALRDWRVDRSPADTGQSRLRVIHASPDAPSVDVAISGGDVLVSGATFQHAPKAIEVKGGTYDLEMRPTGSTQVVQSLPGVTVPAGKACTVVALGLLNDDGSLDILTLFAPLNDALMPATGVGTSARPARDPVGIPLMFGAISLILLVAGGTVVRYRHANGS